MEQNFFQNRACSSVDIGGKTFFSETVIDQETLTFFYT